MPDPRRPRSANLSHSTSIPGHHTRVLEPRRETTLSDCPQPRPSHPPHRNVVLRRAVPRSVAARILPQRARAVTGLSPSGPRHLWRVSTPGPRVCDFTRGGAPSRNGGLGGRVQPHHPVVTKRRHHPVVAEQSDGRWVVKCAECRRGIGSVPIGIDTPDFAQMRPS